MHQSNRVDRVQANPLQRAGIFFRDNLMIAGIGIDDAAASGGHSLHAALIDWLQEYQNRAWSHDILRLKKLLSAAELAGCDIVLDTRDNHRDDCPWL